MKKYALVPIDDLLELVSRSNVLLMIECVGIDNWTDTSQEEYEEEYGSIQATIEDVMYVIIEL